MEDKQKKYEAKGISFGKNGKPTESSMKKAFEKDKELFLDLQNDYFTTRGTMGDNPFKDTAKRILKSGDDFIKGMVSSPPTHKKNITGDKK